MKDEHKLFMKIALLFGEKSTCDRAHCGCVIVKDGRVCATGYNGAVSGEPHCDDIGHMLVKDNCIRTVHAEQNAIAFCAKNGISINGAECFSTHFPCVVCIKLLRQCGISKIYYKVPYRIDENPFKHLIKIEEVKDEVQNL